MYYEEEIEQDENDLEIFKADDEKVYVFSVSRLTVPIARAVSQYIISLLIQ